MPSWFRSLISSFTTRSSNQSPNNPEDTLQQSVVLWVDSMVPLANNALNDPRNLMMMDLIFRYRESAKRIDFWLSGCSSGCCNPENSPSGNLAIGSFPCADWEQTWPLIVTRLREIERDPRSRYHHRIYIPSTPEHASPDTDHTIKHLMIRWGIRPCENVVANLPPEPIVNHDAPIFHCGSLPDLRSDEEREQDK